MPHHPMVTTSLAPSCFVCESVALSPEEYGLWLDTEVEPAQLLLMLDQYTGKMAEHPVATLLGTCTPDLTKPVAIKNIAHAGMMNYAIIYKKYFRIIVTHLLSSVDL